MTSPSRLLLTFYGDDFTGSTDTMEVLAQAGLRTLLFMDPPSSAEIAARGDVQAVGVAGCSRAMSPAEMDAALPEVFQDLAALGAPIVRYKVCSTFDSSPSVGSIGRAIELGAQATDSAYVPLVVGAPALGRYCVFGNLFARSGLDTEPFRLDRHPTMSRHPVTPMDESDLRAHLAKQTSRTCALVDVLDLSAPRAELDRRFAGRLAGRPGIVLFDTLREDHLPAIGRLVWEAAEAAPPVFVAGSSGVEYALAAHWRSEGRFEEPGEMTCGAADALVVVSGSCSPVTAQQIDYATRHGFHEIALDTEALVAPTTRDAAESRYADEASDAVARGESVTLHTARGPDDPRVEATRRLVGAPAAAAATLGGSLGRILSAILSQTRVPRAVVTGGDSSYHAARALGIRSLETVAPIQPGSPMCRVHADNAAVDGVEMLFKGGQVGRPDIFIHALRGSAP